MEKIFFLVALVIFILRIINSVSKANKQVPKPTETGMENQKIPQSLEELLKQFGEPQKQKKESPKKEEERQKGFSITNYEEEGMEFNKTLVDYEDPEQHYMGLTKKDTQTDQHMKPYQIKKRRVHKYKKLLQSAQDVKKAVIISEIIN